MTTIIYGGSGGIGSAIATRLADQGAAIHLVARDKDRLAAVADQTRATFTSADVTDREAAAAATEAAGDTISGLVFAVGSINLKPLGRLSEDDFLNDFRLNALSAANVIQAALPAMRKAGSASVVLFSTVAVQQGFPAHASVAMAKGAVEGLTRALAAELAPNVRVNAIAPSLTRTELAAPLLANPQMEKALAGMHPLGRLGEPHDTAGLACFLLSSEAAWMTGQVIAADGGRGRLRVKG